MMRMMIRLGSGFLMLALAGAAAAGPATATNSNQWSTNWTDLFDGTSLANWAVTDFSGHGAITVESNCLKIAMGDDLSGVNWTNGPLPKTNYEISVDAVKQAGGDFFVGLTFPVADSWCSLILGGWGGGIAGLSSLDGQDASENETTRALYFETGHWYHVVVRVTPAKIQVWLDKDKIIDASIAGRKVDVRAGAIYMSEPLGMATYSTTASYKNFKLRLLEH